MRFHGRCHTGNTARSGTECALPVCFSPPYHCLTCPQVTRLQENVQRGEQDMAAAEGQIYTLKEAQDKLLEELDATRARLRETSNLLTALQVCMNEHLCLVFTRRLTCCTLSYNWPDQLKTAFAELNYQVLDELVCQENHAICPNFSLCNS